MGKIFSMITRPIKNFNIESRAHKIISQEKPIPAPKYQANINEAERILKENPDSFAELFKKDHTLDKHLKDVYVKSHDTMVEFNRTQNTDRPLPLNRQVVEQYELGFHEPVSVPVGKCTLRQVLKFISNHQIDPDIWNMTKIAIEYKLPEDTIRNIIRHFRIYQVYIPDKKSKAIFAGPMAPKSQISREATRKLLNAKNVKD